MSEPGPLSTSAGGLGVVLVTGGAGFIGCELSHLIGSKASRWVVMDNLHPQVHPTQQRPARLWSGAELVVGDVSDAQDWASLIADVRPDTVVHLAAETGTAQSLSESTRHSMVNVVGTTRMLDALTSVEHVPSHFLLTSSRAVYGEGLWRRPDGTTFQPGLRTHAQLEAGEWDHAGGVHEPNSVASTVPAPTSVYGATKLAQEHLLSAWTGSHDSKLTILRLQNVYGPGQSLTNPYTGIVSLFSQLARDKKSIPLYEDGDITRDFVYIDDVVSALAAALAAPPAGHLRMGDVGTGVRTTIRELAETVARFHGAPEPHVTGQFRDGDVRHAACNVDDTVAQLDWKPQWSMQRGVEALQGWIEQQLEGTAR